MKIFLAKKSEIQKTVSNFDTVFISKKRNIEHQIGRFLTKYIAKNMFNLTNTEIITKDKKPVLASSDLKFSISHSEDYVAVAFSKKEIGLDIEKYKERNLEKLSKYFNKNFDNQEDFYKYWTLFEANYKSNLTNENKTSFKYNDYYIAISSLEECDDIKFYDVLNLTKTTTTLENLELDFREIDKTFFISI